MSFVNRKLREHKEGGFKQVKREKNRNGMRECVCIWLGGVRWCGWSYECVCNNLKSLFTLYSVLKIYQSTLQFLIPMERPLQPLLVFFFLNNNYDVHYNKYIWVCLQTKLKIVISDDHF